MASMVIVNEAVRLQAVQPFWQLLHPPLTRFDAFAELAARALQTTNAFVSLINDHHMKLIGRFGLDATLLPREPVLGTGVLGKPTVHHLADATLDPAACQHPLVEGNLATRFYAAAPLYAANQQVVGLVAVLDPQPRDLSASDAALLERLAGSISQALAHVADEPSAAQAPHQAWQTLIAHSATPLGLVNAGGTLEAISPTISELLGYSSADLLGQSFDQLLHPVDLAANQPALARLHADAGVTITVQTRAMHAAGTWRWLAIELTNLLHDPTVQALVCSYRDITAEHTLRRELATTTTCLREVIGSLQESLICLLDPQGVITTYHGPAVHNPADHIGGWAGQSCECLYPAEAATTGQPKISLAQAAAHGQHTEKGWRVRPNGSLFWASETTKALRASDGTLLGFLKISHDQTQRKQTEDALRASSHFLSTLATDAAVMLFAVDAEGNFTLLEGEGLRGMGLRSAAMIGRSAFESLAEQPQLVADLRRAMAGEQVVAQTMVGLATFDLSYTPFYRGSGELDGVICVATDRSEQQRTTADLHASEERLRLATESAALGTWDWDLTTDRAVWSSSLEALFGLAPGSFDGQPSTFIGYIHPDDRAVTSEAFEQALYNHQPYDTEFRVIWPDRSVHWLSSKGKVFYADEGLPIRMLGICRDTTERKQAEDAYARLADQMLAVAAENARLYLDAEEAIRARDQFLAIAAHELKTPITSLIGYTEMLQTLQLTSLPPRMLRIVQGVARQTTRLEHLIRGIIDLSDLQNGRFRLEAHAVDLHTIAQQVVDDVEQNLTHHTLHYRHPDTPVWITGDAARLEQVLYYLLNNAIKFSPLGGLITISLSVQPPKWHTLPGQVELRISDPGIGIPLNSQVHLFERYFRASNADPQHISGLGVGLYIIREVVNRHQGQIEVTSIEGQGTTFTIQLPLSMQQAASQAEQIVDHTSPSYEAAPLQERCR